MKKVGFYRAMPVRGTAVNSTIDLWAVGRACRHLQGDGFKNIQCRRWERSPGIQRAAHHVGDSRLKSTDTQIWYDASAKQAKRQIKQRAARAILPLFTFLFASLFQSGRNRKYLCLWILPSGHVLPDGIRWKIPLSWNHIYLHKNGCCAAQNREYEFPKSLHPDKLTQWAAMLWIRSAYWWTL